MASQEAIETKNIITGLLISNPLRCTISQLSNDFRNMVGYGIPVRKLGYQSIEEYLRSIPDTVKVIGSGLSAEVQVVVKAKSAHINAMVAKQKKDSIPMYKRKNIKKSTVILPQKGFRNLSIRAIEDRPILQCKIPKLMQNNLRKLMLQFQNGIPCSRLPSTYENMFRESLRYEKFYYRSLIEMCIDLPEIFQYEQDTYGDYMLYNKSSGKLTESESTKTETINNETEKSNINWSLGPALIPNDVVQFLEEIPRYNLKDLKNGNSMDIKIGDIYAIHNFWIYPKYGNYNDLLDDLQIFFGSNRNRYTIPDAFLIEGLYCTVYYKKRYHRAAISQVLEASIQVLFIDYGITENIENRNVWYLPKKFATIPSQAIRAKLSNVVEAESSETLEKFNELISGNLLYAGITTINHRDMELEIELFASSNQTDICVNDALVEKGYAEFYL